MKCGENLKLKCKVNLVINSRITIGFMTYTESGYSWCDDLNSEYLPKFHEEIFKNKF